MGGPFLSNALNLLLASPHLDCFSIVYMALTLDLEGALVRLATKLDGPDPQPRVEVRGFVRD